MGECEICGLDLPEQPGRGRPLRYCSPYHRQLGYWNRKLKEAYERGVEDGHRKAVNEVRGLTGLEPVDS